MKRHVIWVIPLIFTLAACGGSRSPEDRAQWFFQKGQKYILRSIEKQGATPEQMKEARAVLMRHEKTVTQNIANVLRKHHDVFAGVVAGEKSKTLVALEQSLHEIHGKTVRSIGVMHEELEAAVGKKIWKAATAEMASRMKKPLRD